MEFRGVRKMGAPARRRVPAKVFATFAIFSISRDFSATRRRAPRRGTKGERGVSHPSAAVKTLATAAAYLSDYSLSRSLSPPPSLSTSRFRGDGVTRILAKSSDVMKVLDARNSLLGESASPRGAHSSRRQCPFRH